MDSLERQLAGPQWGLTRARSIAAALAGDPRSIRALIAALFGESRDSETGWMLEGLGRSTALDQSSGLLRRRRGESRTRWHLRGGSGSGPAYSGAAAASCTAHGAADGG